MVCRWPTVKNANVAVHFAPDLKLFSIQQDENLQVWRFDPSWVR